MLLAFWERPLHLILACVIYAPTIACSDASASLERTHAITPISGPHERGATIRAAQGLLFFPGRSELFQPKCFAVMHLFPGRLGERNQEGSDVKLVLCYLECLSFIVLID